LEQYHIFRKKKDPRLRIIFRNYFAAFFGFFASFFRELLPLAMDVLLMLLCV